MKALPLALIVAVVVTLVIDAAAQQAKDTIRPLPFESNDHLFQPVPGDTIRLESTADEKAMHWTVNYTARQLRGCTKDVAKGSLGGMKALTFRGRADANHQLWVQLNESSGEKFYKIVDLEKEWNSLILPVDGFQLNKDKVINGRLDMDDVSRIVLLDFAAADGKAKGSRNMWFADFAFSSRASSAGRGKQDFYRPQTTGKVGMTCVPKDFLETETQWLDFFTMANDSGVQVLSLQSGLWAKDESAPDTYDFKTWENFFAIVDKHGFDFEFSKDIGGPFFLDKVNVPKDIRFKSFSDPVLQDRYAKFVTAYLDRFGDRHAYVVIHAEGAESYFAKHPDQLDPYCEFLTSVRKVIQLGWPRIKVGVNTDTSAPDAVLSKLAAVTDFMAYDVVKGKVVRKPSDFTTLTERLVRVSNGKKIAFQNAGWSTSKTDSSSDEEQVAFIREFFRVLNRHRDHVEYASFGAMYDHDTGITGPAYRALFSDLPPTTVERIVDSMSHFGLFRSDGTAKPGWSVYQSEVKAYYK